MGELHVRAGSSTSTTGRRPDQLTPWQARPMRSLLIVTALLGGFGATFWFFVRSESGQLIDDTGFWHLASPASWTGSVLANTAQTVLTVVTVIAALGAVLAAQRLICAVGPLRARPRIWVGITLVVVSYGAAILLRDLVLQRPQVGLYEVVNTFPNVHVTVVVALGAMALLLAPSRAPWWVLGYGALVLAQSLAVVAHGAHRPSDALGGILLGSAIAVFTSSTLRPLSVPLPAHPRESTSGAPGSAGAANGVSSGRTVGAGASVLMGSGGPDGTAGVVGVIDAERSLSTVSGAEPLVGATSWMPQNFEATAAASSPAIPTSTITPSVRPIDPWWDVDAWAEIRRIAQT